MTKHIFRAAPMVAVAAAGVIVGLAAPVAAQQAHHLISGSTIKPSSIPGNRLKPNAVTGREVKESSLGAVPLASVASTAHKVTPATVHPITLLNGWTTFAPEGGPVYRPAAYSIDAQGYVHLQGTITGGSSSTVCVLPDGVRPSVEISMPITEGATEIGNLEIRADGTLIVYDVGGAFGDAAAHASLEGVTFAGP